MPCYITASPRWSARRFWWAASSWLREWFPSERGSSSSRPLHSAVASFKTHEEAEAWFTSQPEPPEQSRITISGGAYLAVYHRNVKHRALYPFSMALDEEEQGGDDAQEP